MLEHLLKSPLTCLLDNAVVLLLSKEYISSPYCVEEIQLLLKAPAKLLPVPCDIDRNDVEAIAVKGNAVATADPELQQRWECLLDELHEVSTLESWSCHDQAVCSLMLPVCSVTLNCTDSIACRLA